MLTVFWVVSAATTVDAVKALRMAATAKRRFMIVLLLFGSAPIASPIVFKIRLFTVGF